MSARDTILTALTAYYGSSTDPRGMAVRVLDGYDADRRDYLLAERSDVRDRMVRDAHAAGRAEALAEADLLAKADVVAWLLKRAHEYPTGPDRHESVPDAIVRLASKVDRGAVRPDNLRVSGGTVLTIPVHAAPDFFEPGRTYLHQHEWKFRCDAVTAHPVTGKRVAVGYSVFSHSDCQTSDLGDSAWADGEWTDVTGSGEGQ